MGASTIIGTVKGFTPQEALDVLIKEGIVRSDCDPYSGDWNTIEEVSKVHPLQSLEEAVRYAEERGVDIEKKSCEALLIGSERMLRIVKVLMMGRNTKVGPFAVRNDARTVLVKDTFGQASQAAIVLSLQSGTPHTIVQQSKERDVVAVTSIDHRPRTKGFKERDNCKEVDFHQYMFVGSACT